MYRNGNKIKANGRPPSITIKFLRFFDKDLLFDNNVIRKRRSMYNNINFHHCICEGMIEIQNSIKEHSSVKFVNSYMGATRYFTAYDYV